MWDYVCRQSLLSSNIGLLNHVHSKRKMRFIKSSGTFQLKWNNEMLSIASIYSKKKEAFFERECHSTRVPLNEFHFKLELKTANSNVRGFVSHLKCIKTMEN